MAFLEKLFGSQNERYLKRTRNLVKKINSKEDEIKELSDDQLKNKTLEFRERYKKGESLDDLLPEAFAVVREASWRVLGQRHYDVQMIGAIALHEGNIAEMKTGEGKTLASTPAIYLNAIPGLGLHVITVNDYLAKRDSQWMGPIFTFLGLTVGVILNNMENDERKDNYSRDITYGTNNEFGFDYLRDNMKPSLDMKVQRGFNYCIVDEIDSVLIDEARTPLIISGSAENDTKFIVNAKKMAASFVECEKNPDGRYPDEADPLNPQKPVGDYKIDEKSKNVTFTDDGMTKAEKLLLAKKLISGSLFDQENFEYIHYLTQALKARYLFKRDVDYMVKSNEVIIIDEHTGRAMEGRRYSDGLHQAIEAKENITIQRRSKTFATVTFQNFFRMYEKLAGMTGTADTEAAEFKNIYNLDVVVIPTNRPIQRIDNSDKVYLTHREKLRAIANNIRDLYKKGQPVLVGTISVERSEELSKLLKKENVPHNVLNAKNHAREAEIIQRAGRLNAVTIATNMAGRGTDIKLGGDRKYDEEFEELLIIEDLTSDDRNVLLDIKQLVDKMKIEEAEELTEKLSSKIKALCQKNIIEEGYDWIEEHNKVKEIGGLFVLGTERHESRRIDNQLRGRSGRQGDPGGSTFYISLEDDLMRLFGGDRMKSMLTRFGISEGEEIEHPWISKTIERAQKKVESRNFEIRKHLIDYDDVMNNQRKYIYGKRDEILSDTNIIERVLENKDDIIDFCMDDYFENLKKDQTHAILELVKSFKEYLYTDATSVVQDYKDSPKKIGEILKELTTKDLLAKEKLIGKDNINHLLRVFYLGLIDRFWQDHLNNMEQLRESVRLRAYSQKNPLIEYKLEGAKMFEDLIAKISTSVITQIFKIKIETVSESSGYNDDKLDYKHREVGSFSGGEGDKAKNETNVKMSGDKIRVSTTIVKGDKIGRNDPCPCGSGKKYKKCCGK